MVIDRNFRGEISANIEDYPEGLVLVVNKPWRWTSADVIRKIKFASCRHFGKKNLKVGHAGTLDPLADGVLIVCLGNACKQAQAIQATFKQYLAGVCFGAVTASYDREKPLEQYGTLVIDERSGKELSGMLEAELGKVLEGMKGPQEQVAPLFSAKQVDGVRAYELARKLHRQGLKTDQAAAELLNIGHIEIKDLRLEKFTLTPISDDATPCEGASGRINVAPVPAGLPLAYVRIDCSKGTYIRALARDLGEKMECGAFLYSLCRTGCGEYSVENALSVEDVLKILKTD